MANPPFRRPSNWCVSSRNAFAFPSKCVKSSHSIEESCSPSGCLSFKNCPLPSEKKVDMARSPECPKGGLPKSCARQAAETIEPISGRKDSCSSGWRSRIAFATSFPNERPTQDTSRLCVSRLCTKILPGKGNTWVLFCSRRKGAEKMRRSKMESSPTCQKCKQQSRKG